MYHQHNNPWGPSPTSSESNLPANNPFLESSAANRFPALDTSQQSFQPSSPYPSHSISPTPSQFQQQSTYAAPQNQFQQWNGQPQLQSPSYGQGAFGYGPPQQQPQPTGFAPFGQQFGQQSPYGGQPQLQSQVTGYPQYQQSQVSPQQYQQHQQNIISQFDPYSGLTNGWDGQGQNQNQNQNQGGAGAASSNPPRTGPSGQQHPLHYIQSHKSELETWDAGSWKQALLTFEELKKAWEMRRVELQRYLVAGQYLGADEIAHVNGMIKSSESNIDSVTASLIQMQEVHSGYKHSLDAASKRRVREALNAGLQGLPEWP